MAQERDDGWGCGVLVIIVLAYFAWTHIHSPEKKAQAEAAAVSGEAATPSPIDSTLAKMNPVRGEFNEDRAEDAARDSISGDTYEAVVGSGDCTDDCSGHEAGWQWAKEGNTCGGGDSESFDAGCQAFESEIDDRVQNARHQYDEGDDTFAGEN